MTEFNGGTIALSEFWTVAAPLSIGAIFIPLLLFWIPAQAVDLANRGFISTLISWPKMVNFACFVFVLTIGAIHFQNWTNIKLDDLTDPNYLDDFYPSVHGLLQAKGFFKKLSQIEPIIVNTIFGSLCLLQVLVCLAQSGLGNLIQPRSGKLWFADPWGWFYVVEAVLSFICAGVAVVDSTAITLVLPWAVVVCFVIGLLAIVIVKAVWKKATQLL